MRALRLRHGSDEWRAARARLLGASEVPALFDAGHAGDTYLRLVTEKAGLGSVEKSDTSAMQDGRELEPWVAGRAAKRSGLKLRSAHDRLYVDDARRLCASLDYAAVGTGEPCEVKCVRSFLFRDEWGARPSALGEGTAPLRVELQVQQQLLLTGAERGFIVAYCDMTHYGPWERRPNAEMRAAIIERAAMFWDIVDAAVRDPGFLNRVPVVAADCELLDQLFPRRNLKARAIIEDDKLAGLAAQMIFYRENLREFQREADKLKAEALLRLGGVDWAECLGYEFRRAANGALNVKAMKGETA